MHGSRGIFIKKNIFFIFSLETFQSHRGYNIAIIHNGYAVAPPGLKCFKEKKIIIINFYFISFPLKHFNPGGATA
jgi:hypothetical protein